MKFTTHFDSFNITTAINIQSDGIHVVVFLLFFFIAALLPTSVLIARELRLGKWTGAVRSREVPKWLKTYVAWFPWSESPVSFSSTSFTKPYLAHSQPQQNPTKDVGGDLSSKPIVLILTAQAPSTRNSGGTRGGRNYASFSWSWQCGNHAPQIARPWLPLKYIFARKESDNATKICKL